MKTRYYCTLCDRPLEGVDDSSYPLDLPDGWSQQVGLDYAQCDGSRLTGDLTDDEELSMIDHAARGWVRQFAADDDAWTFSVPLANDGFTLRRGDCVDEYEPVG